MKDGCFSGEWFRLVPIHVYRLLAVLAGTVVLFGSQLSADAVVVTTAGGYLSGVTIEDFSSALTGRDAANLVNGSGFNEETGTHANSANGTMWGNDAPPFSGSDVLPISVTFDLEDNYELDRVKVWNWNDGSSLNVLKAGAKDVTISVASSVGGPFTSLGNFVFDMAPGTADVDFGQVIDLSGFAAAADARLVKFDITSNYGTSYVNLSGLSEVRFLLSDVAGPVVVSLSPADDVTEVAIGSNLMMTFNENIQIGSGNITITNLDTAASTVIPVGDAQVSVSGAVLTINLSENLTADAHYAVLMDAGVVTDLASNAFAGVADTTTWSFSTMEVDRSITGVTVVNSSPWYSDSNPEGIINGEGLADDGLHNSTRGHNFLSNMNDYDVYVSLDLGGTYTLTNIHVWNYNETDLPSRSAKNVEIWVSSTDTNGFIKLNNAGGDFVFPQAPGGADYAGFDVDLSGVVNTSALDVVRRVRFNITSNYDDSWTGLAEVRFEGVAVHADLRGIANHPGRIRVFLLAGQSNMKGQGYTSELTAPYDAAQTNVLFWDNGAWMDLAPGFGNTSDQFGPEVSFGYTVEQALPSDKVLLIKYAANGTALYNDWAPTSGPEYSAFMSTARAALANLDANGVDYEISAMLWLQGESDALENQGAAYETSLRNFIADMRTQFSRSDLPFYIARVRTYYGSAEQSGLVRTAQEVVAESTDNVEWFDTDSYNPLINGGHYGTDGQLGIGIDFANTYLATDPASNPLRIMCVGDSITAGYTDNPNWTVPFNFGYRSGLYTRLHDAGENFTFVGTSPEPWDNKWGDPSFDGTVTPALDLRILGQDHHEGYGGWGISGIQGIITNRIAINHPDVILLMIGINGISSGSPAQLNTLVSTIVSTAPDVHLIVAQIAPKSSYSADLYNYNTYIRETLVPAYAAAGAKISTVDLYSLYLTDPDDPTSIDSSLFSNGINHPAAEVYDRIAQEWFDGIWRMGLLGQPVGRLRVDSGTLLMDWNSKTGKRYNLRSSTNLMTSPLTWPIFGSYSNLMVNEVSLPLSNDISRFFIIQECDF